MDLEQVNRCIVTGKCADIGFQGNCLNFAIALKRLLNKGIYYCLSNVAETDPYHVLLRYEDYIIDCATFTSFEKFKGICEKERILLTEMHVMRDGKECSVEFLGEEEKIRQILRFLRKIL